jgi:tetratricopeptide (TPR) repeat protein
MSNTSTFISVKTNIRRPVDFVGRDAEIKKILTALSENTRAWIILITGVGGIGKTEIAVQVAHILREECKYENIVWTTAKQFWLTPDGVEKHAPEYALTSLNDLLNTIIDVLEMDPRYFSISVERKIHLVNEKLKKSKTLLIIDNFETVEDRAIFQFLVNMPPGPSKALVTSRLEGVDIKGTPIHLSQRLEGQLEIRIGPLTEEDATTLMVIRAKDHGIDLSNGKVVKKVREVANGAARIPLALEWIVSQMALKGYTLDDSLNLLRSSKGDVLNYCFDNLLRAVGRKAEKMLLAIPIFPDSVDADILMAVTEMSKEARDESLRKLVAASLIELEPDGKYSVLAPTRLLVATLSRDVLDLYQKYSLRAVRYYVNQLPLADISQKWKTVEVEINNIIHLYNWCFENDYYDEMLDLAHTLSSNLQRLALWDQRAHVCEFATLAASYIGKSHDAIDFSYDAAEIHKHRGRLSKALEEFRKCEDFANQTGDKRKVAHARMQTGIVLFRMGRNRDADDILRQTLSLHIANGDKNGQGITLSCLGRNKLVQGSYKEARYFFEESLRLKIDLSDKLGESISLYDFGHYYHVTGDLQKAEEYFDKSMENLDKLGDKRHLLNAKRYYAHLKMDQGEFNQAKNLLIDVLLSEEQFQRDLRIS